MGAGSGADHQQQARDPARGLHSPRQWDPGGLLLARGGGAEGQAADGKWVQNEVKALEDGQICVPCGHYGYYLMWDYEVISKNMTTDDLLAYECDDRDYYGIVNWK